MSNLNDCTASELGALFRAKEASPCEALDALLKRIEEIDPAINAFRVVDEDGARQAARAADLRWHSNVPLSPLDGVPVSVKDLILTRGMSTLRGSLSVDAQQAWDTDAPAVARLREAGAVLFGKTNTPEFGCKGVTDSFLTGITRNPHRLSATSGGSSGGAAAAVAARMGPLALGTDGAGSVRIPSAFCGVAGLKASFGRVPAWPASPFGTLAHVGPHARSVRDLALALTIMAGAGRRDWYALPPESPDSLDYARQIDGGVKGLRIAFSPTLGYARVEPAIAAACEQAASTLEAMGAIVERCDPGFEDPIELICALWFVGAATLVAGIAPTLHAKLDPVLCRQAEQGNRLTAVDLARINMRRADLGRRMREFHARFDLLLTPAVAVTAMAAQSTERVSAPDPAQFLGWTPFSYPFNLTQQPALSLPAGLAPNGLPVAVQLVAPMYQDALLLRAAHVLEAGLPPTPAPALS